MGQIFTKKNIINFLILGIMVLAIPLSINLVRQQQILKSRATAASIEFLDKAHGGSTDCVVSKTGGGQRATCPNISVRITAPTGGDVHLTQTASIVSKVYALECNPGDGVNACPTDKGTGHSYCVWAEGGNYEGGCVTEVCSNGASPPDCNPPPPAEQPPAPPAGGGQQCDSEADYTVYERCDTSECGKAIWSCKDDSSKTKSLGFPDDHGCSSPTSNCACATGGCAAPLSPPPPAGGNNLGQACAGYMQTCDGGTQWCTPGKYIKDDSGNTVCGFDPDATAGKCVLEPGSTTEGCNIQTTAPTTGCPDLPQYCDKDQAGKLQTFQCTGGRYDPSDPFAASDGCVRNCNPVAGDPAKCADPGINTVDPGTGGCCKQDTDCKASNTYQGQSTEGFKCTGFLGLCKDNGRAQPNFCEKSAGGPVAPGGGITCCTKDSQCPSGQTCTDSSVASCTASGKKACKASSQGVGPSNPQPPGGSNVAPPITQFRYVWGDRTDLNKPGVSWQTLPASGTIIVDNTQITNTTPGPKFLWVQFGDSSSPPKVTEPPTSKQLDFSGADPKITGDSCDPRVDLKDGSLIFKIKGENFGGKKGSLKADNTSLDVRDSDWKDDEVRGRLANPSDTSAGHTFQVTLTRSDGATATQSCDVSTTQITLGANWICQTPTKLDLPNVDMSVFQIASPSAGVVNPSAPSSFIASKTRETVTISQGVIKNIKAKLQERLWYIICLKAPRSLRLCTSSFPASSGNNVLTNFNLPFGDLNSDDTINSIDGSQLRQQWGKVTAAKNCDFNGDGVCNSFEYSCMLRYFNKSSQEEPQ